MSNALAVAGTTAALVNRLDAVLAPHADLGHATADRPDVQAANDTAVGIRVFLYRVQPSAALRNDDLPTRRGDALVDRPRAALSLQYLLSFVGGETILAPDRMLGLTATNLHTRPTLSDDEIRDGWTETGLASPMDLADAPEFVRITPLALSLEDLAHLWSSFFGPPYRLSMAVQADVVVLSPQDTPSRALPVLTRRLLAGPLLAPSIRSVVGEPGPLGMPQPIVAGSTIIISGSDLRGPDGTRLWFGDRAIAPEPLTMQRAEVVVPIDARPGVVGLSVEPLRILGEPPRSTPAGRSRVFPVVVAPEIDDATLEVTGLVGGGGPPASTRSGRIQFSLKTAIGPRQTVAVIVNGGGDSATFTEDVARTIETPAISVPFAGLLPGEYLVRVVVSGVESALTPSTPPPGQPVEFVKPKVTVP